MKGIIVGLDESPQARAALRWAVDEARHSGQPVTAVLAWGHVDQHHLEHGVPFDPAYNATSASRVLDEIVDDAIGRDDDIGRLAVCDLPARALIDAAKDAALLVVGARGMGGFRSLLLGSISRQILHDATCPVAVIRDDADRAGREVVVGVDGSGPSQRALEWAIEYARGRRLPLAAVHAWHLPYTTHSWYSPYPDPDKLAGQADAFLQAQVRRVDTSGVQVECRSIAERPAGALLTAATLASVVVVGSRGHGQLASALLGSVADQVIHHTTCPVVVVP